MTNEMRAAVKRLWGRGPEYARVLRADKDTVVVLLSGVLTDAERTLLAARRDSTVVSARAALHEALEPEIRALVETHIGRETNAFISGIDVDRDIASVVVTLR
jgi:uncharacterized protein YbcI